MTFESTATASWGAVRDAMVHADTAALDTLLTDGFTLAHMTGFVQPKSDWLAAIDDERMQYHHIRDVEVRALPEDDALIVRTMTDATIWGGRADWRLQLRLRLRPTAGAASTRVTEIRASTW